MSSPLTFEELELPVLRWSLELPAFAQVELLRGEPAEGVPSLTGDQVDDALRRLEGEGLLVGGRVEGAGAFHWDGPRPTAHGLRVLGEWSPTEEASLQEVLAAALQRLAEDLPDEGQASVARRGGSGFARMAGGVVERTPSRPSCGGSGDRSSAVRGALRDDPLGQPGRACPPTPGRAPS